MLLHRVATAKAVLTPRNNNISIHSKSWQHAWYTMHLCLTMLDYAWRRCGSCMQSHRDRYRGTAGSLLWSSKAKLWLSREEQHINTQPRWMMHTLMTPMVTIYSMATANLQLVTHVNQFKGRQTHETWFPMWAYLGNKVFSDFVESLGTALLALRLMVSSTTLVCAGWSMLLQEVMVVLNVLLGLWCIIWDYVAGFCRLGPARSARGEDNVPIGTLHFNVPNLYILTQRKCLQTLSMF